MHNKSLVRSMQIPPVLIQKYERYLPTAFDESMSLLQKVNKMIEFFNQLIKSHDSIVDILDEHNIKLHQLQEEVVYWGKEMEKIRNGEYEYLYLESIENWINKNLIELVGNIAKIVWFGLNDDGYFIATIPESWEQIQFDTTNDGELVLEY